MLIEVDKSTFLIKHALYRNYLSQLRYASVHIDDILKKVSEIPQNESLMGRGKIWIEL